MNTKLEATSYRCPNCKNNMQGMFEEDHQHGQVTCKRCGVVVQDRKVHDGEWKRQFSGEENPSQHGPAPDPRFSSGHNLRTNLSQGSGQGAGSQTSKKDLMDLKNAQERVEMNLSNLKFGIGVHATRIGYKDKMKRAVFIEIEEVGQSLQLHEVVIREAQTLFADFRDAVEQLTQRETITAACMLIALRNAQNAGEDVFSAGKDSVSGSSSSNSNKRARDEGTQPSLKVSKPKLTFEQLHPFKCPKCGRIFGSKKDVRFHFRTCPNKNKPNLVRQVDPPPTSNSGAPAPAPVVVSPNPTK